MKVDDILTCSTMVVHERLLKEVQNKLPPQELIQQTADFLKIFADPTRIRILYALLQSELCVCDIGKLLDLEQSNISHQLRILKQSRLVKYRREGKVVFYSLNDNHIRKILDNGMEHVNETLSLLQTKL